MFDLSWILFLQAERWRTVWQTSGWRLWPERVRLHWIRAPDLPGCSAHAWPEHHPSGPQGRKQDKVHPTTCTHHHPHSHKPVVAIVTCSYKEMRWSSVYFSLVIYLHNELVCVLFFSAWKRYVREQGQQWRQNHRLWACPAHGRREANQGALWHGRVLCPWDHQLWASVLLHWHVVTGRCLLRSVSFTTFFIEKLWFVPFAEIYERKSILCYFKIRD